MNKLSKQSIENCIKTPTSCNEWNGGDIEYLGICNGDSLNNVTWEIVSKLKELAGDDLSQFDLSELLHICNQSSPLDITLISILTVLKNNQICLKDYIDTLNERIDELAGSANVDVNLKCYAEIDTIGNTLSITREGLDQLVIDQLCNHKGRIETLESKIQVLQTEVDNIDPHATVDEPKFTTCDNSTVQSTSLHVKGLATSLCNLRTSTGDSTKIAQALSKSPADWNTKFSTIQGWNLTPAQWAEQYGNLLLVVGDLVTRIESIENNCCAPTCDDIKVGFTAVRNDNDDGIILSFTSGAGTRIPTGYVDKGSTISVTDIHGVSEDFNITISNGGEEEIILTSLDLTNKLEINITSKIGNDSLICEKCINKTMRVGSSCCVLTNSGTDDITIFYDVPLTTPIT